MPARIVCTFCADGLCRWCVRREKQRERAAKKRRAKGSRVNGEAGLAYAGPWKRVRLTLTREDVLGQRGAAHAAVGSFERRSGGRAG